MKASVFIPCSVDQYSAETGFNLIKLLQSLDVEVCYNENQTCCGKVAYFEGDKETAKLLAEQFMSCHRGADYIIGCSSSCLAYMKRYYANLFVNSGYHNTFAEYLKRLYDITDFIVHVLKKQSVDAVFNHKVAMVDDISTRNDYGLYNEPRLLLENVKGLTLIELKDSNISCGHANMFASTFEPISTELARRKVQDAINKGAEYITSTDMGCLLHLQSYINKAKLPISCKHIVDILVSNE